MATAVAVPFYTIEQYLKDEYRNTKATSTMWTASSRSATWAKPTTPTCRVNLP